MRTVEPGEVEATGTEHDSFGPSPYTASESLIIDGMADQIGLSLSGASNWSKATGSARGEYVACAAQ